VTSPTLAAALAGSNVIVSWVSPSPAFVLQQASQLPGGANFWTEIFNHPTLAGESNVATMPLAAGITNHFYRAMQR
jgi:hypothetical protein